MCTVDRLTEILKEDFNTIPIVNTYGTIIGLIPKNFIIVLIENKMWYENRMTKRKTMIEDSY